MSANNESRGATSRPFDHPRFHLATATLTIAAVLLAYMTFFGKPDATSIAVSESRVTELVLLAGATILTVSFSSEHPIYGRWTRKEQDSR